MFFTIKIKDLRAMMKGIDNIFIVVGVLLSLWTVSIAINAVIYYWLVQLGGLILNWIF